MLSWTQLKNAELLWGVAAFVLGACLASGSALRSPTPDLCKDRVRLEAGRALPMRRTHVAANRRHAKAKDRRWEKKPVQRPNRVVYSAQGPAGQEEPRHSPVDGYRQLPKALRKPIAGPKLFVGDSVWVQRAQLPRKPKRRAAKRRSLRSPKPARLRLRRVARGGRVLEYRAGQRLRPETLRVASRDKLVLLVPANASTLGQLHRFSMNKKGLTTKARRMGSSKLSLQVRCDHRCEIGKVSPTARGWALRIHATAEN